MHKRPPVTFTCHMRATKFDVACWLLTTLGRWAWWRPACQLMSPEDAFQKASTVCMWCELFPRCEVYTHLYTPPYTKHPGSPTTSPEAHPRCAAHQRWTGLITSRARYRSRRWIPNSPGGYKLWWCELYVVTTIYIHIRNMDIQVELTCLHPGQTFDRPSAWSHGQVSSPDFWRDFWGDMRQVVSIPWRNPPCQNTQENTWGIHVIVNETGW
jgi:hypothetical protein